MMPPDHALWVYRARCERVIDGDTLVLTIDAGFGVHIGRGNEGAHVRLADVDTPERNEPGWAEARQFAQDWIVHSVSYANQLEWPLRIKTQKVDAFGRYIAEVWRVNDQTCLNVELLQAGHARPYVRTVASDE